MNFKSGTSLSSLGTGGGEGGGSLHDYVKLWNVTVFVWTCIMCILHYVYINVHIFHMCFTVHLPYIGYGLITFIWCVYFFLYTNIHPEKNLELFFTSIELSFTEMHLTKIVILLKVRDWLWLMMSMSLLIFVKEVLAFQTNLNKQIIV